MFEQYALFAILALVLIFFIWGRWRYDLVAIGALLAAGLVGILNYGDLFTGFSHPAVIIIVSVLILSHSLISSGVVEWIARKMHFLTGRPFLAIPVLTAISTLLSVFVYSVGALALMMPVAVKIAKDSKLSPSLFLLPLAFATHLGGFVTLVSAAPNIIISSFREEAGLGHFAMFDFAYVGIWLAIIGVLFLSLIGWRLLPKREGQDQDLVSIDDYVTELKIKSGSEIEQQHIKDLKEKLKDRAELVALIKSDGRKIPVPPDFEILQKGDSLIVKADAEVLTALVDELELEIAGKKTLSESLTSKEKPDSMEVVITPESKMIGQTLSELDLNWRYETSILAISRSGQKIEDQLKDVALRAGDVILIYGREEKLNHLITDLNLLPLAEREITLGRPRKMLSAVGLFVGAIILATLNIAPIEIIFALAAFLAIALNLLPIKEVYKSVDWPIIFSIAAIIPLGLALKTTGAAESMTDYLLSLGSWLSPEIVLVLFLLLTMILSDLINSVGAAVLLAPIAVFVAEGLGVSMDPFLMAVAIGCSCAFMTPIGHQTNTLVLGPGGYKFSDFLRVGLPLNLIILVVSIPLLLKFWPL